LVWVVDSIGSVEGRSVCRWCRGDESSFLQIFCRCKIGVDVLIVGGLLGRLIASSFSLLSQKAWPFVHDFGDATFSIRWPLEAPASKFNVDVEEVMGGGNAGQQLSSR